MHERRQVILRSAEKQAFALRNGYVGRKMKVLFENVEEKKDRIMGHTDNFLPVFVAKNAAQANDIVEVELLSNHPDGLLGRVIS